MEALRELEENRATTPTFGPEPRPTVRKWSLEDFLKHHPTKFDGKTSLDWNKISFLNKRIRDLCICSKIRKHIWGKRKNVKLGFFEKRKEFK